MIAASRARVLWVLIAALCFPDLVNAQEPPPPPPAPAPAPDGDEPQEVSPEVKAKAKFHFQKGKKLRDQQAWEPALAEFKLSIELYPTGAATSNAAYALNRLRRYDEAVTGVTAVTGHVPC